MKDPSETVQAAHEFVENVDWELIEDAADMGAAVVEYMRKHPWMLVAAGSALAGMGLWQVLQEKAQSSDRARRIADLVKR